MNGKYGEIRGKIFSSFLGTYVYLFHIVYLILLIIYPIAIEDLGFPFWVLTVLLSFFILFTMVLPEKINYAIILIGTITIIYVLFYLTEQYDVTTHQYLIKSILLFLLSVSIFSALVGEIIRSEISVSLLYLSIDCYLLLGLCFTFLLRSMHYLDPGSLNFDITEDFNHIYMSFIVLTSTGLGDLLPTTLPTKAVIILNGLLGQIYLTFFAAVIVGKYLSRAQRP